MRGFLVIGFVCSLSHLVIASPASACKWDSETALREEQFKSSYQENPNGGAISLNSLQIQAMAGTAVGLVLFVGALIICKRAFQLRFSRQLRESPLRTRVNPWQDF